MIKEPDNALGNIDSYFQKSSNQYGFEILPKAERWNSGNSLSRIGPFLLRQENVSEAIDVIERWAEYRPKSITALKELAKAYAVNNQFNKAISVLEKALALSTQLNIDKSNEYLIQIDELKEEMAKKRN